MNIKQLLALLAALLLIYALPVQAMAEEAEAQACLLYTSPSPRD